MARGRAARGRFDSVPRSRPAILTRARGEWIAALFYSRDEAPSGASSQPMETIMPSEATAVLTQSNTTAEMDLEPKTVGKPKFMPTFHRDAYRQSDLIAQGKAA